MDSIFFVLFVLDANGAFTFALFPLDLRPFARRVQHIWPSAKAIFKSRCVPGNAFLKTAVWVRGSVQWHRGRKRGTGAAEEGNALNPSLYRRSTSNLQKQMQSGKLKI